MELRLDNICKSYGETQVLHGFSHSFPAGKASCILGASGCGKTTLLRLIAGLDRPDSGAISGIADKKISAVFQEDRLFENLSAEKNILLTARKGFGRADAQQLLAELGLSENTHIPVREFSGGMKRRVAIARALAADYELLLLDEPFTGLDEDTRRQAIQTILRRTEGRTVICVTHDAADALRMNADILRL